MDTVISSKFKKLFLTTPHPDYQTRSVHHPVYLWFVESAGDTSLNSGIPEQDESHSIQRWEKRHSFGGSIGLIIFPFSCTRLRIFLISRSLSLLTSTGFQ